MSVASNKNIKPAGKHKECEAYVPFESAEETWFWFIAAQQARNDGARYIAGLGNMHRPCEPVDILKILDSLYRKRRLLRDHLLVLRHYGRRFMPPDLGRVKEQRAYYIWREALERLEPILEEKGIIASSNWAQQESFSFLKEGDSA